MKFNVDSKFLAFTLLNALPQTPEWNMFTSSVINTLEQDQLTFDTIEVRVMSEHARLNSQEFRSLHRRRSQQNKEMKSGANTTKHMDMSPRNVSHKKNG